MNIKNILKKLFWRFGYDVIRFTPDCHPIARRKKILDQFKIDAVIDVGANIGQFAKHLRKDIGYIGKIVSFEPLSSAFRLLKSNAELDVNWVVYNNAIGECDGEILINISGNSYSSSILPMLQQHLTSAPESKYISEEKVKIKRLDSVFQEISGPSKNVFLKIDTQGYEKNVVTGAENCLHRVKFIQLEMSLVKLYEQECLLSDMINILQSKGFQLISLENGFSDKVSGRVLQVDGIFERI